MSSEDRLPPSEDEPTNESPLPRKQKKKKNTSILVRYNKTSASDQDLKSELSFNSKSKLKRDTTGNNDVFGESQDTQRGSFSDQEHSVRGSTRSLPRSQVVRSRAARKTNSFYEINGTSSTGVDQLFEDMENQTEDSERVASGRGIKGVNKKSSFSVHRPIRRKLKKTLSKNNASMRDIAATEAMSSLGPLGKPLGIQRKEGEEETGERANDEDKPPPRKFQKLKDVDADSSLMLYTQV